MREESGIPNVCSLRGSDINLYPHYGKISMRLTKKVISGTDQLISVSNALKLVAGTVATPKREIRVIYNGCDLEMFSPDREIRNRLRRQLALTERDRAVIFVGSIARQKGIYELLEAFGRLKADYTGLRLILVGDGPDRNSAEEAVIRKGLADAVHFTGRQSGQNVRGYLNAADFLVLPTHAEGLPNVILEGMACGLPVIASHVGGIPEVVNEDTGVLAPPADAPGLTESIRHALEKNWDSAHIRKSMGRFTWERNVRSTVKVYAEVLRR
jgi:glycosyltransferase involved in cell wall biosynthesis